MRVSSLLAGFALLSLSLQHAGANAQTAQAAHEPGTGSTQLAPANQQPKPVQAPDMRLDSKPHTDIDASLDSSMPPMDLGLGASPFLDLGPDIVPTAPPEMVAHTVNDDSRNAYYALPERREDSITPEDRSTLAARQTDLLHAAGSRHFDLAQPGWAYRQTVCPQSATGAPSHALLLHYTRNNDDAHGAQFTALVPQDAAQAVLILTPDHKPKKKKPEKAVKLLSSKRSRAATAEALPPATLYPSLAPLQPWMAASACVAAVGGATPNIPNEPYLSDETLTAPAPTLMLGLKGTREIVFTDREDEGHYSVWTEHVTAKGRVEDAEREAYTIKPRPVQDPPVPVAHMLANIPQPPSRITPEPPSPLSGEKQ